MEIKSILHRTLNILKNCKLIQVLEVLEIFQACENWKKNEQVTIHQKIFIIFKSFQVFAVLQKVFFGGHGFQRFQWFRVIFLERFES